MANGRSAVISGIQVCRCLLKIRINTNYVQLSINNDKSAQHNYLNQSCKTLERGLQNGGNAKIQKIAFSVMQFYYYFSLTITVFVASLLPTFKDDAENQQSYVIHR